MAKQNNDRALVEWLDKPATLRCGYGQVGGSLQYGIRVPINPGTTPLQRCNPSKPEKIGRENSSYWFVSPNHDIKVRTPQERMITVTPQLIEGVGHDGKDFDLTITRE